MVRHNQLFFCVQPIKSASELFKNFSSVTEICTIYVLVLFLRNELDEASTVITATVLRDPDDIKAKALRLRIRTVTTSEKDGKELFKHGDWQSACDKFSEGLEVCIAQQINNKHSYFMLENWC